MEKQFFISDGCVSERLKDELIILNIETGIYHQLNSIGIIVWNEIEKHNPSRLELIDRLKEKFPEDHIEDDITKFLDDLLERKLIFLK